MALPRWLDPLYTAEEMRASDARAAEIIDRSEALTPEELTRLHGAIREMGMAR